MHDKEYWLDLWSEIADFETLTASVCAAARATANADGATFVLREGDRCFYAAEDSIAPLWKGQRFPIRECISGWAMVHREQAVIANIEVDERIPIAAYRPTFVRSLTMTPMRREQPLGAVGVYWAVRRTPTPEQVAALQPLADAAADVVERIGVQNAPWLPNFALDRADRTLDPADRTLDPA